MVSAPLLTALFFVSLLVNKGASSSTGQQSRPHSPKSYPIDGQHSHGYKPTSILSEQGSSSSSRARSTLSKLYSSGRMIDDFARLNKRNRYGGPITRDSVHEAVMQTKRQMPSQDIVVIMGAASWDS
mmetsp:Transcript_40709/g.85526  ORF Transcript_40709/g.85526 Transcript_40709/m.85526 type:complete len:127 (+) Transcript_40709:24-404(+)